MRSPLAIDLFCGLGGWTEGLLAEGYRVVGFDNERHVYGEARYPAKLVLQDVLTIHGRQFKDAALIVASPPCQEYSYMAMPWTRAKQIAREYRDGTRDVKQLTALFDACFRIQREASEAAGRHIPLVVENVCGAQKWVGRARWHFGSFYLWGDVPALMPIVKRHIKVPTMGAGWYPPDHPKHRPGLAFNGHAERAIKNDGGSLDIQRDDYGVKVAGNKLSENGLTIPVARRIDKSMKPAGFKLSTDDRRQHLSYSRKAASANIAKIPLPLSRHIARAWRPNA